MSSIGADRAEAKARRILFGLGFDDDMQVKPTKNFSGKLGFSTATPPTTCCSTHCLRSSQKVH